jgi:uncharacterized phage protein (TIGR01671 family)
MREIQFRGKELETGKWVYGFFCIDGDGAYIINDTSEGIRGDCINVDRRTVGQYINRNDKNDTEIYEGDIIRITRGIHSKYPFTETRYVVWVNCGFRLAKDELTKDDDLEANLVGFRGGVLEVIGNVFDNPKLLKYWPIRNPELLKSEVRP